VRNASPANSGAVNSSAPPGTSGTSGAATGGPSAIVSANTIRVAVASVGASPGISASVRGSLR